jgi:uncharacterized membrane protein HdeD (DUF308 family)
METFFLKWKDQRESEATNMLESMARNWWTLLVRGIVAVILGIAVLVWPGIALSALVFLWGAYAVVDGIFALVMAFRGQPAYANRWVVALQGTVSLIAGVIAFVWPGITALALLYLVAFWAIFTGILELVAAIQLRKELTGEFWLGLDGVLSIVFGALLIFYPSAGLLSIVWLLGIYAIVYGAALIILGFRLHGAAPRGDTPQQTQPV